MKPYELFGRIDKLQNYLQSHNLHQGGAETGLKQSGMAALLDDIRSLHNVGSIFRTSDAAGFSRLYLCGITGVPTMKSMAKTSLGAENHVGWQYFGSALKCIQALKSQNVLLVALEKTPTSLPLSDIIVQGKLTLPLCMVVGNEVSGVSKEVLAHCDLICHLPMRGHKESLNVSVAYGIAAYSIAESFCISENLSIPS